MTKCTKSLQDKWLELNTVCGETISIFLFLHILRILLCRIFRCPSCSLNKFGLERRRDRKIDSQRASFSKEKNVAASCLHASLWVVLSRNQRLFPRGKTACRRKRKHGVPKCIV